MEFNNEMDQKSREMLNQNQEITLGRIWRGTLFRQGKEIAARIRTLDGGEDGGLIDLMNLDDVIEWDHKTKSSYQNGYIDQLTTMLFYHDNETANGIEKPVTVGDIKVWYDKAIVHLAKQIHLTTKNSTSRTQAP